jgi:hypothetical protein
VQPHVRAPYHGALELVPRLAIGALLVNTSLSWGRFTIDLNNLVCQQIGPGVLPGWAAVSSADAGELLSNLIAIVVYLLVGVLLVTQMLMRLALVDALLIVAPLAMLCWVVPQTYGWARLWFQTFFSTIFVQVLQVVVLQLGSALVGDLARQMPAVLSNPLDGGRAWMSSLMLGVAVLQLARLAPRLVPGYPMGGWPVPRDLGPRQLLATVSGGRFGGDRSGRK